MEFLIHKYNNIVEQMKIQASKMKLRELVNIFRTLSTDEQDFSVYGQILGTEITKKRKARYIVFDKETFNIESVHQFYTKELCAKVGSVPRLKILDVAYPKAQETLNKINEINGKNFC